MAITKLPAIILISTLSAVLSACGGSGGGGSNTSSSTGGQSVEVSGYAVKGVVSEGIITAWGVDKDGSLSRLGDPVRTSETGFYSLNLKTSSTLVKLELTSDGNTRMRCDAVDGCAGYGGTVAADFGEEFWPGPNLQLETVVAVGNDQSQGHLTPLTTLSTTYFESTGTHAGWKGFQKARRQVEAWFGLEEGAVGLTPVDITRELPADIRQAELDAALVNSAFLGLAEDFKVTGVQGAIDAFRNQILTNGGINNVGTKGEKGSDDILTYAAIHALKIAEDGSSPATVALEAAGDRLAPKTGADDSVAQPGDSSGNGSIGGDKNPETGSSEPGSDTDQETVQNPPTGQQPGSDSGSTPDQDPVADTVTATLTWQAPLTRQNGTSLSMGEIDQYVVRYGTQPDVNQMTSEVVVEDGQSMKTEVDGLTEGTWYFAMRTVDQNGLESAWSEVASKTITQ